MTARDRHPRIGSRRGGALTATTDQNLCGLLAEARYGAGRATWCAAVAEKRMIEPGFLRLLADTHTAIAAVMLKAVDAELAEQEGGV